METTLHYIQFSEIGVTFAVIVAAMTFVVLTWNAVRAILDWRALAKKPTVDHMSEQDGRIDDHEERIEKLESCCEEVRGKLKADWDFQQDEMEMNQLMLKSIKRLLQHAVDGNDTSKLVEMEQEIDDYLLQHTR